MRLSSIMLLLRLRLKFFPVLNCVPIIVAALLQCVFQRLQFHNRQVVIYDHAMDNLSFKRQTVIYTELALTLH